MKDLSILIINYKTPTLLRHCIKSVYKNEPDLDYEIIAVDNASKDKSVEIIDDDFPQVKLIVNQQNLGFPKAVNQGILASKGKYILILNPDITALPGSIEKMFYFLEENKNVAVLAPKLINPNGTIQYSCFSTFPTSQIVLYRRTPLGKSPKALKLIEDYRMTDWDHLKGTEVAWVLGSCMMVRREAINQIGLMDERFFMYMEDVDWCRRFWQAGWQAYYYPEALMVHYYQRSSASESGILLSLFNKQTRIHIKSALKYFLKYARTGKVRSPNL
jgi:hypothetical protein